MEYAGGGGILSLFCVSLSSTWASAGPSRITACPDAAQHQQGPASQQDRIRLVYQQINPTQGNQYVCQVCLSLCLVRHAYELAPVSLCFSGLKPPEETLNFLNSRGFVSKFKPQRHQANSWQRTIFYNVLLSCSCVLLNIKLRLLKKKQKLSDKTSENHGFEGAGSLQARPQNSVFLAMFSGIGKTKVSYITQQICNNY
jgi:hypothetical protein